MKKSILLFSACLIAGLANAQQAQKSVLFNNVSGAYAQGATPAAAATHVDHYARPKTAAPGYTLAGARTTIAGPGRWYDYFNMIQDGVYAGSGGSTYTGLSTWQNFTSYFGYTPSGGAPTYYRDSFTSVGFVLNPFFAPWNDSNYFGSNVVGLTPFNAYTIDSLHAGGWYGHSYASTAKTNVVDTLELTFVQGNDSPNYDIQVYSFGSSTAAHYGTGLLNLPFLEMFHDSVVNEAGHLVGPSGSFTVTPVATTAKYQFLMTASDTNLSTGKNMTFPRPGHVPADPIINFPVTAGNWVGVGVSLKSGDNTYVNGDTIGYANNTYKYGAYEAELLYRTTSPGGTTADWPVWHSDDLSTGHFKKEGSATWGGLYIPTWGWTSGGGTAPATIQFPAIAFHTNCPTCVALGTPILAVKTLTDLSKISVVPNPANANLSISFPQGTGETANVALTNMVGQTVASQAVTNGLATFNTSALPAGVYIYSVKANGQSTTGRVVVAH